MRILIYIEPFPVRQTMDHFGGPAAAFAKMLLSESASEHLNEFDIRLYANRETLTHVQDEAMAAKRFFLRPESEEQDQFRASLTEWPNRGVRTWTSLLRGEGEVTDRYRQIFERIHGRFAFDVVVTLGDNGAARAFAQGANVDHVVMDFSFSQPSLFDAVLFDPLGAGGASLMAQIDVSAVRAMVDKDTWPAELDQAGVPSLASGESRRASIGSIDFTGQDRILRRGNGRAAYLCLQHFDDQLLRAHSQFDSPAEVLGTVLPVLADNNILTVVRPPQGDLSGPGQAEALNEARRSLRAFSDTVLWLDRPSERVSDVRLYSLCDHVVTANGAAGLEAALFGRQVCVLGNAAYKPEGAFPGLEAIASRHFDTRTYQKNIAALRALLLRSRLVPQREALFSFDVFANRLVQTREAWHDNKQNPRLTLEETYSRYAPPTSAALKAQFDHRPAKPAEANIQDMEPEPTRPGAIQAWNRSVSSLTNRARQSIGRRIKKSGLSNAPGMGPLASNPLFTQEPSEPPKSLAALPIHPVNEEDQLIISAAHAALEKRRKTRSSLAVIAHCFYRDTTQQLVDRLLALDARFDLFASVPPFGGDEIKRILREAFPTAKIITMPNRGGDVWPFCFILSALEPDKYSHVLKLHAAKPHYETDAVSQDVGPAWLDYCLTCLLGPAGSNERIGEILEGQNTCSMAGPEGLLTSTKGQAMELDFDPANVLSALDLEAVPHHWTYFTGGMYWFDFKSLEPLVKSFSKPDYYAPGALTFSCQMRSLAGIAFALAAHQSTHPICALTPDLARPKLEPIPGDASTNEALRAYLAANA
ncbi:MAG: rhamnan synthesis F family protein [Pseudomonadota bacterium]